MKIIQIIYTISILLFMYSCTSSKAIVVTDLSTTITPRKEQFPDTMPIQPTKIKEYQNCWLSLDSGLFYAEWDAPVKSFRGDSKIITLKIDPDWYELKLVMASEDDKIARTGPEWASKYGLTAAINAAMFETDYLTSCGYMKNFNFINNGKMRKSYKSLIAFNPNSDSLPTVNILELDSIDKNPDLTKYETVIQNIRMINSKRENVWKPNNKQWSIACFGIDSTGSSIFIFSRSPYSVHEFGNFLLNLPLKLKNVSYLDGGKPAFFYLNTDDFVKETTGSFETNSIDNEESYRFYRLPNVLGIKKREKCFKSISTNLSKQINYNYK